MYYPNGPQGSSHMSQFQGNQPYAMMQRQAQQQRQTFAAPQQQYQQQHRSVVPQQAASNAQFMQVPVAPVNQNFMNGHLTVPNGYQSFNYNAPQPNHGFPVPLNDERCRKQLIVNYLAPDVVCAELHKLFSRFGPLDGARIIYDRQTNMPKGYGFVYFTHPEDAKEAFKSMNGFEFHGKRLKVGYSTNPLNIVPTVPTQYAHGAIV